MKKPANVLLSDVVGGHDTQHGTTHQNTLHQVPANWTPGRQYLKPLTMIQGYLPKNQGWCFLKQLVCVRVYQNLYCIHCITIANPRVMTFKTQIVDITSLYLKKNMVQITWAPRSEWRAKNILPRSWMFQIAPFGGGGELLLQEPIW